MTASDHLETIPFDHLVSTHLDRLEQDLSVRALPPRRFLSVDGEIAAKSTASEPVRKKDAATGRGKLGDAIRQLRAVVPCTPNEIAATVLDGAA
jgi:hypothetical protein